MKEEKNELSKLIFLDTTRIRNSTSQLYCKLPSTMPAMKYRCGIYTGNEVLQTNNYLFHWVCSAVSHESKVWTIEPIPCSRMEPESNHSHPMSTHSSHNHTKDTTRSFHALDSWCLLGFERVEFSSCSETSLASSEMVCLPLVQNKTWEWCESETYAHDASTQQEVTRDLRKEISLSWQLRLFDLH